jgi:N-dimethylarginine dimethylaminohydrolase
VTVHWLDWGDAPMGAYGPLQATWAAQELLIINGGAVVPKLGWHPFSFGRTEYMAHWAFWNLNIPTLLTISGKGAVAEAGATVWLAQDVYVVGLSAAYNQAGLDQLLDMVRLTAGVDHLEVLTIRCQGKLYFDRTTGASAHVTNLIAPLDVDKVLAYKPGIDTATLLWLERNGYEMIEPVFAEHVRNDVCNLKILEPGRVVMAAEAKGTIDRVRKAGVEVIEVPYSGFQHAGGGFHCTTMEIYREPGPLLADR